MKTEQRKIEWLVGAFVLLGLLGLSFLALKTGAGSLLGTDTYIIQARFSNIGGLTPGSNILISGVSVGRVESVRLDLNNYSAVARLSLRKEVQIPADSMASIKTNGLIGEKYVAIAPGSDAPRLAPGGLITDTESAIDLESLIRRVAFGSIQEKSTKENK